MGNFDFECKQKKRLAQQAKHRKCGSKSKKCNLSTDHMTNKQWRERCGETVSINMNKPISWEKFKKLSKTVQEEYLNGLIDRFGINASILGAMFGVHGQTVRNYVAVNGLNVKFNRHGKPSYVSTVMWKDFLDENAAEDAMLAALAEAAQEEPETSEDAEVDSEVQEERTNKMTVKRYSLCFKGKLDITSISNSLLHIMGNDAEGEIEIVCNLD